MAETRQFVFHVVPAPKHLGFYAALFDALTSLADPATTSAEMASERPQASGAHDGGRHTAAVWPHVVVCVVGVILLMHVDPDVRRNAIHDRLPSMRLVETCSAPVMARVDDRTEEA